ncbi:unnamed protein product [Closterium sp. NIES-53]
MTADIKAPAMVRGLECLLHQNSLLSRTAMSPHPPAPASSSQATVELGAAIERSLSRVHELERTVSLFNESNQLLLLDRMSVALLLSLSPVAFFEPQQP